MECNWAVIADIIWPKIYKTRIRWDYSIIKNGNNCKNYLKFAQSGWNFAQPIYFLGDFLNFFYWDTDHFRIWSREFIVAFDHLIFRFSLLSSSFNAERCNFYFTNQANKCIVRRKRVKLKARETNCNTLVRIFLIV